MLGALASLVAAELYVRPMYTLRVTYEPGIGQVNAPGTSRWMREGSGRGHWLPHGVRLTPGVPKGNADDVLVLGDSFTEGLMLDDPELFPAVAQEALGAERAPLRLVNAGRSGMSAASYVHLAPVYRSLFSPRWTVVELRSSDLEQEAFESSRWQWFVTGDDGEVTAAGRPEPEPALSGPRAWLRWARWHSVLLDYAFVRRNEVVDAMHREPPLFHAGAIAAPAPPAPKAYPVEREMDRLFAAYEGRMTVLYLSVLDPRHPGEEEPTERRVREYCERHGVSCVFTRGENARAWSERYQVPSGFANTSFNAGHLNAGGHGIAGRVLAAELGRLLPSIRAREP
jgi:hypothetical protein